jgi:hypothetical protein
MSKHDVYQRFCEDEIISSDSSSCSFSQFRKIWRKDFKTVTIPKSNRFGACTQCEKFKAMVEKAVLEKDKGECYLLVIHNCII